MEEKKKKEINWKLANISAFTGIVLVVSLIGLLVERQLIDGDVFSNISKAVLGIKAPTPTIEITPYPTFSLPTATPNDSLTEAPVQQDYQQSYQPQINANTIYASPTPVYQNYGWYPVGSSGQSEQYVNGQWYSTPQQGNQAPTIEQNNNQSSSNGTQWGYTCVQVAGETQSICSSNCLSEVQSHSISEQAYLSCLDTCNKQQQNADQNCITEAH
jgi:hypothetical protein